MTKGIIITAAVLTVAAEELAAVGKVVGKELAELAIEFAKGIWNWLKPVPYPWEA